MKIDCFKLNTKNSLIILVLINILIQSKRVVNCIDEAETSLELVQLLFRHGDRSPIRAYPYDPYNESVWSNYSGYGQLITSGIRRAHDFGDFLRHRYATFIGEFYNKNEVSVRSTDYDRTLMTAMSILSGLFPPVEYQKWNQQINWQPIPVHTVDVKLDNLFYMNDCPYGKELYEKVKNGDEFKNYLLENMNFFKELNSDIGPNSNVTIDDMEHIADGIFIQKQNNLTIPGWANKYYDKIIQIGRYSYNFYFLTTEQARLAAGALLNEMIQNIQIKTQNNTSKQKFHFYSSHDTYVAAMIRLLNLTQPLTQPPYVSAVVFELRKSLNDNTKYYVQCFLKNNPIDEAINFKRLRISSCSDYLCPLDEFLKLTQNLIIKDYLNECKQKNSVVLVGKLKYSFLFYASISLSFTFAIMFSVMSIMNYIHFKQILTKNRTNQSRQYETVNLIIGDFNEDDDDLVVANTNMNKNS